MVQRLRHILSSLNDVQKSGKYSESELQIQKVLSESVGITDAGERALVQAWALYELGLGYAQRGMNQEALKELQSASVLVEHAEGTEERTIKTKIYATLGAVYFAYSDFQSAFRLYSEALSWAEELDNTALRAQLLGNIGTLHNVTANHTVALEYYQKALLLDESIGNTSGMMNHIGNIGNVYQYQSEYATALDYYRQALALAERENSKPQIARWASNLGTLYDKAFGDYATAIEFLHQALAIDEELGNRAGKAIRYGNLGALYYRNTDFERALIYFQKALTFDEESGNKIGIATKLGNIGLAYKDLGKYDLAIEFLQKSLIIHQDLNDVRSVSRILSSIGKFYVEIGEYTQACHYLEQAHSLAFQSENYHDAASTLGALGFLYAQPEFQSFNLDKSEQYCREAVRLAKHHNEKRPYLEAISLLSQTLEMKGNYKEALALQRTFNIEERKLFSEASEEKLHKLGVLYEVKKANDEAELTRKKNEELAETLAKVEQLNDELRKLNEEKNDFLGIAAHDLKNPLSTLTLLATILGNEAETLSPAEIREFAEDIRVSSKNMFELVVSLLDVNRLEQKAGQFAESENCSAEEVAHIVVDRNRNAAFKKNIEIFLQSESAEVFADKGLLSQVLDNFISNAVKFSPPNKKIYVEVKKLG